MLTLYSQSFITAARMDGFSYLQGPPSSAFPADRPGLGTKHSKPVPTRAYATLRRIFAGIA